MSSDALSTVTWALGIGLLLSITIIIGSLKALYNLKGGLDTLLERSTQHQKDHDEVKEKVKGIADVQIAHGNRITRLESKVGIHL